MPIQSQFPVSFHGAERRHKLDRLLKKFETAEGDSVVVLRRGLSDEGAFYHVLMGLGTKALHFPIGSFLHFTPDSAAPEINNYTLVGLVGGVHISNMTKGGLWLNFPSAGYGGSYERTSTAGAYAEYPTPDGVTEIGCWDLANVQAAVALVVIDGDPTLASELPTAQDLVNAGRLDSSVLVTNGGTLNPTDRILDAANPTSVVNAGFIDPSRKIRFASNLPPGQHTVRVTHTGYRPIGGTSDHIRLSGFWFDDPAVRVTDIPTAMPTLIEPDPIILSDSDINFAFNYKPSGGSITEWMGHSDTQFTVSAELYVDDVLVSPILAADPYKSGNKAELRVSGYCRHPDSAEKVAEYSQSFIFDPKRGVKIMHDFTWLVPGTATGYMPQLSVNNTLTKASLLDANEDYDLTADDGSAYGQVPTSAAYFWTPGGKWAILCCVPSYANNPVGKVWIQDRSGGGLNKAYFERYYGSTINVGDRIQLQAIYRFKEFDDADAALARPT